MAKLTASPRLSQERFWTDDHTAQTQIWLERFYEAAFSRETVAQAVRQVAATSTRHPIRDYLDKLKWDKVKRLDGWLTSHVMVDDSPIVRAVGACWMLSAVARAYRPGCQADYVLIIEGAQRGGKSSAIRALVPTEDWHLETGVELGSKDAFQMISGKWIVELAEIDSLTRSEAARVKGFITSRVDTYRRAYGHDVVDQPRGCVFAGTVNPEEGAGYLKDNTGGARYWPVRSNATQVNRIDVARLALYRDQLWAEAVSRYKSGEAWHITDEALLRDVAAEQEARRQAHPWEEPVGRYLRRPASQKDGVTVRELLHALDVDDKDAGKARTNAMAMSGVLTALGWTLSGKRLPGPGRPRIYLPGPNALPQLGLVSGSEVGHQKDEEIELSVPPVPLEQPTKNKRPK